MKKVAAGCILIAVCGAAVACSSGTTTSQGKTAPVESAPPSVPGLDSPFGDVLAFLSRQAASGALRVDKGRVVATVTSIDGELDRIKIRYEYRVKDGGAVLRSEECTVRTRHAVLTTIGGVDVIQNRSDPPTCLMEAPGEELRADPVAQDAIPIFYESRFTETWVARCIARWLILSRLSAKPERIQHATDPPPWFAEALARGDFQPNRDAAEGKAWSVSAIKSEGTAAVIELTKVWDYVGLDHKQRRSHLNARCRVSMSQFFDASASQINGTYFIPPEDTGPMRDSGRGAPESTGAVRVFLVGPSSCQFQTDDRMLPPWIEAYGALWLNARNAAAADRAVEEFERWGAAVRSRVRVTGPMGTYLE